MFFIKFCLRLYPICKIPVNIQQTNVIGSANFDMFESDVNIMVWNMKKVCINEEQYP